MHRRFHRQVLFHQKLTSRTGSLAGMERGRSASPETRPRRGRHYR